jgi:hypothetical protein
VIDGAGYLEQLRVRHVEALEASFSLVDPRWRQRLAEPNAYADEAIGFAIPAALRGEILALGALQAPPAAHIELVCSPTATAAIEWAAKLAPTPALRRLERDFEWTSDDSLNTALVPGDALGALLQCCHGLRA